MQQGEGVEFEFMFEAYFCCFNTGTSCFTKYSGKQDVPDSAEWT